MPRKIMLIQGHPDPGKERLCRALAQAYCEGAEQGGHTVRVTDVAELDFPILRSQAEFYGETPEQMQGSIDDLGWADHLVIVYPLWLGTMPALLKAFIEQLFRPGVALGDSEGEKSWPKALLKGKSCRIVLTMGMPAFAYRWIYLAHSLRSLERNILKFSGIKPVRETIIGMVDAANDKTRERWFADMRALGAQAK